MAPPLQFTEVTLSEAQRDAFLERVRAALSTEDYRLLEGMTHALAALLARSGLHGPGAAESRNRKVRSQRGDAFTTNLLAYVDAHPAALYFTGWQHAGENLAQVLRQRAAERGPPIRMCVLHRVQPMPVALLPARASPMKVPHRAPVHLWSVTGFIIKPVGLHGAWFFKAWS